jgi:hypothetical protein
MSTSSFWGKYIAQPVKESRFGIIPVGEHSVSIIDVQALMASHSFKLDDNGKITGITVKENFDKAFDQEILAIVYQDVEGRVLIDRRSSIGWLHADDRDENKNLKATPQMCQQYGLKQVGNRFTNPKGVGVPNKDKTNSCLEIVDRLCSACEVQSPMQLMGMQLDIQVINKPAPEGKTNAEVKAYAKLGTGFKTKATTVGTTPKAEVKPAPAIAVLEPANDDLPF